MSKNMISVKLEGGEALLRALNDLDIGVKGALRAATEAGAEIIAGVAQAMAPGPHVETEVVKATAGVVEVAIGPDKEHWYYQFFETGAAAHEIAGNPLVFEGRSGLIKTAQVSHPGMSARPFLRPAHDEKSDAARDEIGDALRAKIESVKA